MAKKKRKMVKFDPHLGAYLDQQIAKFGFKAIKKKMFGHEAYFLNGHMFTGANEHGIFVNLGEEGVQSTLRDEKGTAPFSPMAGMTMKNYLLLEKQIHAKPAALKKFLERSRDHLIKLGPKDKTKKAGMGGSKKKRAKKITKKAKAKLAKKTAKKAKKLTNRSAKKTSGKKAKNKKK